MAFVFRKEDKEALSRFAYTDMTKDSHSVPKVRDSVFKITWRLSKSTTT